MLTLILFAIVGTIINAPTIYWIVYGVSCIVWVVKTVIEFVKVLMKLEG